MTQLRERPYRAFIDYAQNGEWACTLTLLLRANGEFVLDDEWTSYGGRGGSSARGTWQLVSDVLELAPIESTFSELPVGATTSCRWESDGVVLPSGVRMRRDVRREAEPEGS